MTSAVYDVSYMGSVALPRSTTPLRLVMLQRPLLDLYVTYIPRSRSATPRQLPGRRITLTDRGIIVSAVDVDNDAFYAMPSVIFWETVRSENNLFHIIRMRY